MGPQKPANGAGSRLDIGGLTATRLQPDKIGRTVASVTRNACLDAMIAKAGGRMADPDAMKSVCQTFAQLTAWTIKRSELEERGR